MEWNTLLLWLAGPSCAITLMVALRSSPLMKGWIFVSLVVVAVGALAYWKIPDDAGFIGGGLWAVLILAPGLVQRAIQRSALRQRYDRAQSLSNISAWLHPFDGYWQQPRFFKAMHLAEKGETDAAIGLLQGLQTAPLRIARVAKIQLCRLNGDWAELARWARATIKPTRLAKDPTLLPMFIRALGETGELSDMLRVAAASKLSLHPQLVKYRGICRLYAFAFCGQPQRVNNALSGTLAALPGYVQQYWIATAELAAGMIAAGDARLTSIEQFAPLGARQLIVTRRLNPPAIAATLLTAEDQEILHRLDLEHDQERRFTPHLSHERRPWVTYGLILANLIMFGFESLLGGSTNDDTLYRLGAMVPEAWRIHEYYRLLSANFLHYGTAHILMNMLGLLVIGPFVEFNLGWLGYLALYLLSGVLTMFTVSVFWSMHWMDADYLVGASGAIMAMIGGTAAILLRGWYRERAKAAYRRLIMITGLIALQATFDHFTPQVSGAAHMVGVAWGFVLTSILPHRNRVRPTRGFEVLPMEAE